MNCTECKEKLVELLEGLLSDTQKQTIEEHLKDCQNCRREFNELKELSERLTSDGKTWQQTDLEDAVFTRVIRQQHENLKQADRINRQFRIWRRIMHSKITKYATAAVILFAVVLSITFLDKTVTPVYAIEQTIQASHSIRYIHTKNFWPPHEEPMEAWIEFDATGAGRTFRVQMPEWTDPWGHDGAKTIVWKENKVHLWLKKKKLYAIMQDNEIAEMIFKSTEQFDPKTALAGLQMLHSQGKVDLDIEQPEDKASPIIVTVTFLENSTEEAPMTDTERGMKQLYNIWKGSDNEISKLVLYVDQATTLVTSIESYEQREDQDHCANIMEFYNYNQPIAAEMFVLEDEIPDDAIRVDQTTQEIGLVQGDLTDKEIAVKVVRQFYEALIAKDYAKAGRLYAGLPAEKIQEMFGDMNVIQIISISEPIPHPKRGVGGFQVHCKIEIEKNGVRSIYEPYSPGVRPVHGQPHRWDIHGGVILIKVLHDNEKYKKMTPKEAAEALLTACAEENWDEFQKYWPGSGHERMKDYLGGLEIISIGEPFQKGADPEWFVPYEIKLKNGQVKKHNLVIRNDNVAKRYMYDGGI